MDVVDVVGLRLGYERVGHGPPVVLLHGYIGDGASSWRPQLDALSDDFTLVAWDAPGAGASSDPPEDFGMAGYADCLAAFIERLQLHAPHVVGLSFGGALALELQRRRRAAMSLTLVSAYAGWGGSLPAAAADERLDQALALSQLAPEDVLATLGPTMFTAAPAPDLADGFEQAVLRLHPVGFRAMARASADDLRSALPAIDVPTLVVHGDRDVRAPRSVAEGLRQGIRHSRLHVLTGVGHVCNLEAPDEFNAMLAAFLREHPA